MASNFSDLGKYIGQIFGNKNPQNKTNNQVQNKVAVPRDNVVSTTPITTNRFNNNRNPQSKLTDDLYGVSGVPVSNDTNLVLDTAAPRLFNGEFTSGDSSQKLNNDNIQGMESRKNYVNRPVRYSTNVPQTNCPGAYTRTMRVPNVGFCQDSCIGDDGCKQWSFNNLNQQCFLRDDVKPCNYNTDYTSGTIFQKNPSNVPYPGYSQRKSTVVPDVGFTGAYDKTTYAPNATACKNICLGDDAYNRWSYDNATQQCMLKKGTPVIMAARPGVTSGEVFISRHGIN